LLKLTSKIITIAISARFFMLWFYHYFENQSQSPWYQDKGGTKLLLKKKIQSKIRVFAKNRKTVLVFRRSRANVQSKIEFFRAILLKIFAICPITTRKSLPFLVFAKNCFSSLYDHIKNRAVFASDLRTMFTQKYKKSSGYESLFFRAAFMIVMIIIPWFQCCSIF
jgi:hypothetical protein